MSVIETKSEAVAVRQGWVGGRKMWVALAVVLAVAGGVTAGVLGTWGSSRTSSGAAVRPLTTAERDVPAFFGALTAGQVDRLRAAGYTGRLGASTGGSGAETAQIGFYGGLTKGQLERLIAAGYTGRLGASTAGSS